LVIASHWHYHAALFAIADELQVFAQT